jgi:hypothetical protein
MMIARIYGLMWVLIAAVAGVLYLTDSFTFAAIMVLGFIASVLTGAGMLTIYPALMKEDVSSGRKITMKINDNDLAEGSLQRVG